MRRKRPRRVVLGDPIRLPWAALFGRGVSAYGEEHGGWIITTTPLLLTGDNYHSYQTALNARTLKGYACDGAILEISNPAEARAARKLGIPVVNISGALRNVDLPRLMVDDYLVGRLAAEHLLERGLRRLAYFSGSGPWYSHQRAMGFAQRANEAGVPCEMAEIPNAASPRTSWQRRVAPLGRWLKRLRRPVGLLAAHDSWARVVVDECQRLGLNVPHEVAVIGVDNDTIVCEFCQPTISSVSRDAWQSGYQAAALLDRLMAGKSPPRNDILIPPDGIVARQSTDTVVVDDVQVAVAVRFMSDHVGEAFSMERVLRHVAISRRELELRFRQSLGRSPHDYLCRLRVQAAKTLLERPEYAKLQKIARSCGFSGLKHLRDAFQRVVGMAPVEYHRQWQLRR